MDVSNKPLLYKIVAARDKRYDGRFYCGVLTTGIYCRPICPARPKIENIVFLRSAAEAEKAGFRACLRCRPDLIPDSVRWDGTAATVGRALALIARGEFDESNMVRELSDKLGVSDRHLRRLFDLHIGASPIAVIGSKRLHLAKQLLVQSTLPVTQIAFASGYHSIRRFNEVFKRCYQKPPSSFRKAALNRRQGDGAAIDIALPVIAPYDWTHIYDYLRRHRVDGVEQFCTGSYRRSFAWSGTHGAVEIAYQAKATQLTAKIFLSDVSQLRVVIEKIRDLFDLRSNPHAHLHDVKAADAISTYYKHQLGLRQPGAWNPFETAVTVILGQLVSVEQARSKVAKLVEKFGAEIAVPTFAGCNRLFPSPEQLADADFKGIGLTKSRQQAIRELSRQVIVGAIDLSRGADIDQTRARLRRIKGIGPWTVEMIALRCLGDTNAFPASDLIIERALTHHRLKKGDWSPWNAYIALAIWKKYAAMLSQKRRPRAGTDG